MAQYLQSMYAIYDNKTEAFSAPFFAPTDGAACRMVMDTLSGPETQLSRHPADFNLFCVGQWHSATGEVRGVTPRNMGLLVDYMPKPKDAPSLPFGGNEAV